MQQERPVKLSLCDFETPIPPGVASGSDAYEGETTETAHVTRHFSPCLQWAKRLAFDLELAKGDVVLTCTPNHVFVPVSFLGSAGGGFIFTGVNPASTVHSMPACLSCSVAPGLIANSH